MTNVRLDTIFVFVKIFNFLIFNLRIIIYFMNEEIYKKNFFGIILNFRLKISSIFF